MEPAHARKISLETIANSAQVHSTRSQNVRLVNVTKQDLSTMIVMLNLVNVNVLATLEETVVKDASMDTTTIQNVFVSIFKIY